MWRGQKKPDATDRPEKTVEPTSTKTTIAIAIVAVIIAMGAIVSIWIIVKGGDEPLAGPTAPATGEDATPPAEKFRDDPFFDDLGRPVYTPVDDRGALLTQVAPPSVRAESDAPGGIVLQVVHGNLVLPFSTTDGPTGFTENGVATGFSRTPQGAGLAATHYLAFLSTGNDRISLMKEAGLVEDDEGFLQQIVMLNAQGGEGAAENGRSQIAPEFLRVEYHDDLSRVSHGVRLRAPNGETGNLIGWMDLVWRDGTGWIVKIRGPETFKTDWADSLEGWSQWW
ncbi:hypothetical protein AS9A_P20061 (plasmid) [Hoyosella subflava DQS3-9A1]|uniref:DUF8175 domain-containing protein n=2 Tax=Hoyosella TaxID=697025 RepID=F6ESI4_HOYSD|nr:hypothetical protein AS9A_P20061 [Hoyosella subflava DQS3-9A1]